MSISTSSASGRTATVAVEVWIRPWLSVLGTRCTRWTPLSYFMTEYTLSPEILNSMVLNPPASDGLEDRTSIFHLREEAKRSYILNRSPAKMAASSPPAAPRISTMVSFSSAGSAGMSMNFTSSAMPGSFASIAAISSWANSFISGSASISLAAARSSSAST